MTIAVHGIDVLFLVVAAVVFLIGTIVAFVIVEPRAMRWLWASVPFGLIFLTLSFLIKGLAVPYEKQSSTRGTHRVVNTETGQVKATGTNEVHVDTQLHLLSTLEHDPDFQPASTPTRRHPAPPSPPAPAETPADS